MSRHQSTEPSGHGAGEPVHTEAIPPSGRGTSGGTGSTQALRWGSAVARTSHGPWWWLASVRPDGAPHVVPVLAVWAQPVFVVASKLSTRKSRNLLADERCVLSKDAGDLHLVVEASAQRVTDEAGLRRASEAFRTVYEWPTEVVDDELDAEGGAPTSGGPPYAVFGLTPTLAFGFPADGESFAPTRWRFGRAPRT